MLVPIGFVRSTFPAIQRLILLIAVLSGGIAVAPANLVTYQVDMSLQRILGTFNQAGGDTVVVAGTFTTTDWTTTSVLTQSVADTNIYIGTFNNNVPSNSFENHKFIINPGGNSPAGSLIWESGNNRFFQVAGTNQTLPVDYFDRLAPGTIIVTQVTFRVNFEGQIAAGVPVTGVSVSSDVLNDWSLTASPLTNHPFQTNMWRQTFTVTNVAGSNVNYKFVRHYPSSGTLIHVPENDGVGRNGATNRQFMTSASFPLLPLVDFNNQALPMEFIAGADMSHLVFFEDRGVVYRQNGVVQDALTMLRNRGLNCVRLRLFTSNAAQAQADPYDYTNNLTYNLPLAVRAKNAGLKFLLDFHFSDTWADPGKQVKPSAWTNFNFTELNAQVRDYTSNTIAAFNAAGALPDYVQVGNEITPGFLWNDGRVGGSFDNTNQWLQLAQLLTSAIQGIKDAAGSQMPKIIIHIDRGGDWGGTQWYFDNLEARQVPFDYIGESYYPFYHGSPDALRNCLTNAANRYGRRLIVAETGFPWANSTNLFGIPATTNGQVQFVVTLAQIVNGVPGGKGVGIFWWATEYQQLNGQGLAGFDRKSFFFSNGDILPVADAYGQLSAPIALTATRSGPLALKLTWPMSGAAMQLMRATNLSPTGNWVAISGATYTNGAFTFLLPMGTGSGFFRLQSK